jgi:UDP-N-acetylmuramoyl-L-alanyl-D-glutamate--2,6-diaminopimelate ligase
VKTITAIPAGSKSVVNLPSGDEIELTVHLPGEFNVVNAVGALVCAISVGVDPGVAAEGISACGGVPGRMERILDPRGSAGVIALVDYAHTPDAVERAISAVRAGSHGQIITVLGAGGDRDRAKRPLMGQAAASLADTVIVTDDNPRSESPQSIRQAIIEGASSVAGAIVLEVADRQSAIAHAVQLAAPGDVILVLGKGHEQGQEVNGVSTPFDDRLVLAQQLTAAAGQPVNPGGGL